MILIFYVVSVHNVYLFHCGHCRFSAQYIITFFKFRMFRGTYFVVINFVQKDDFMVGIAAERDDTRDLLTLFTSVFRLFLLKIL